MNATKHTTQRGFTLVELLVVIGIIAALAAVVIPNVGRFVGSGDSTANVAETQEVQAAMDIYMADNALTVVAANTTETNDFVTAPVVLYPNYLRQNPTKCQYTWTVDGLVAQGSC
jgi:type IV pilus assembly protein PilA